jgi:hypothetical protein
MATSEIGGAHSQLLDDARRGRRRAFRAATASRSESRGVSERRCAADGGHSDSQPHRHGYLRHQHAHRAGGRYGVFEAGEELEIDFTFECWLTPQQYTVTVATQHPDGSSHDWLDDAIAFDVVDTRVAAGVANLRAKSGMARIAIKVHPRAKRTAITGRLGEAYKLDLKAPPVDGKANAGVHPVLRGAGGRAAERGADCARARRRG